MRMACGGAAAIFLTLRGRRETAHFEIVLASATRPTPFVRPCVTCAAADRLAIDLTPMRDDVGPAPARVRFSVKYIIGSRGGRADQGHQAWEKQRLGAARKGAVDHHGDPFLHREHASLVATLDKAGGYPQRALTHHIEGHGRLRAVRGCAASASSRCSVERARQKRRKWCHRHNVNQVSACQAVDACLSYWAAWPKR